MNFADGSIRNIVSFQQTGGFWPRESNILMEMNVRSHSRKGWDFPRLFKQP